MRKISSPLRYPGGKQRLAKEIAKYVPKDFVEYREPFLGGGSVYFHLRNLGMSNMAWLNDLYYPLFQFWTAVEREADNLIKSINYIKNFNSDGASIFDDAKFYGKQYLNSWNLDPAVELDFCFYAACYFILNRLSFSGLGLCGGYSKASFEGRFKDSHINMIKRCSVPMKGAKITNLDYSELLTAPPITESDKVFIYMDPPYDIKSNNLYGNKGDTHKTFDHEKFAQDCKACPYKWLITYNDNPKIRELFSFANIHEVPVKYSMNSIPKNKIELFITNY